MTASTRFHKRRAPGIEQLVSWQAQLTTAPVIAEPITLRLTPDETHKLAGKHFTITMDRQEAKALAAQLLNLVRQLGDLL